MAALLVPQRPVMLLALAGAVTYGIGAFAVTIGINVPMNDALAAATPTVENAATLWREWNHVRTLASIIALALLTTAVVVEHQR